MSLPKEVWQSFVVLAIILLVIGIYALGINSLAYLYIVQINDIVLICYLLWRVETLSSLTPAPSPIGEGSIYSQRGGSVDKVTTPLPLAGGAGGEAEQIGTLLQQHCIDTQLYLQHDLTVFQLAQAIGINRLYLSHYFSRQGMSYNVYINDLCINHFVCLYNEAIAANRPFTVQQLAHESGCQSYSTFSLAFKQRMGQSVTAWMRINNDKKFGRYGNYP